MGHSEALVVHLVGKVNDLFCLSIQTAMLWRNSNALGSTDF